MTDTALFEQLMEFQTPEISLEIMSLGCFLFLQTPLLRSSQIYNPVNILQSSSKALLFNTYPFRKSSLYDTYPMLTSLHSPLSCIPTHSLK